MKGGAVLKYVMLLQRDVPKAVQFYSEGLGLQVNCVTERWAELQSGETKLALKAADG
jgi:catechol 2,3-dioxygenase-like lactoylglutathione lyase family enzyme